MAYGQRIKQFGLAAYDSLEQFSRELGWKWHKLYPVIMGHEEPSTELLKSLAERGCNINWLLTGRGDIFAAFPLQEVPPLSEALHEPTPAEILPENVPEHARGDVEFLDIATLSPKAIRSLNIHIKKPKM